jgi:probable F420-dependent oxidoreductase
MSIQLGRIGLWVGARVWRDNEDSLVAACREAENLGFTAIWIGGASGDLQLPRSILAATKSVVVATGIVSVWVNPPRELAAVSTALANLYPDRFLLGLGISHPTHIAPLGLAYRRPDETMNRYLDALDSAAPPVAKQHRILAALGPRFLRLAGTRSAGAHPYMVTPSHSADARAALGPEPLLAPELRVVLDQNRATARAAARGAISRTLHLENYRRSLLRQGFEERDLDHDGSDRLIDELVAWGSPDDVAAKISAHLAAGADHVALQVVCNGDGIPVREWGMLAAACQSVIATARAPVRRAVRSEDPRENAGL